MTIEETSGDSSFYLRPAFEDNPIDHHEKASITITIKCKGL